jgi:hypothetical protein
MRTHAVVALFTAFLASPVFAHHISGTLYCDRDGDGVIDVPGDTPIPSVTVIATSLDVSPGQQFSTGADLNGFYTMGLPQVTDRYRVAPSGLPAGWTVVVPTGGFYVIQIVTGTAQDHADNVNFLVQGCAPPTTTTSTTTTTTTTSTTSTTIPTVCNCAGTPFLAARDVRLNNDADIRASVGANDDDGRVRLGKAVIMPDGTSITGDTVILGNGASVFQVFANTLQVGSGADIRGGTGTPTLPILSPFCTLPAIACGSNDVIVPPNQSVGPLAPGVYGLLHVLNGASVTLAPGDFTFCDLRTGRDSKVTALGKTVIDVERDVIVGTDSFLGPASGTEPIRVTAGGRMVRLTQSAEANVSFVAPDARISFGRDAHLIGCFCTERAKSDKHITLECAQ